MPTSEIIRQSSLRQKLSIILAATTAILICLRHISGIEIPLAAVSALSLGLFFVSLRGRISVCLPLLATLFILAVSLVLNPTPDFSARTQRFIAMSAGLLCFSPLLSDDGLIDARRTAARTLFVVFSSTACISLILWGYCLLQYSNHFDAGFNHYGFRGIMKYGMTLSPVSALAAITSFWLMFRSDVRRRNRILWTGLALVATVCCVAAGSRMAVLSLALSLLLIAAFRYRILLGFLKTRAGIITAASVIVVLAVAIPRALDVLQLKQAVGESHKSMFYSREKLWHDRCEEFRLSPIIGIGYANQTTPHSAESEDKTNGIEPGSSWLTVLTYGGILGAAAFLWFLADLLRRLLSRRKSEEFSLLSAILLFLLLNMITEGWLFFAGALMFPVFWLTCAEIYSRRQ